MKFNRYCESVLTINCPGQYQGIDMKETKPGIWQSERSGDDSTVNITIPRNYTQMFKSATSENGSTISGMFDIQYRRWTIDHTELIEKGEPYIRGKSRYIENLVKEDAVLLKEGLIIDTRSSPGIGFRNHTIPLNTKYGGTWNEDITWIEPVTQCAHTNLSVEFRTEIPLESFLPNNTVYMVDRGAFLGLQYGNLESRPWLDKQDLDLLAHAQKAARMHNVLVASNLEIPLPLEEGTETLPPRPLAAPLITETDFQWLKLSRMEGLRDLSALVSLYNSNKSKISSDGLPDHQTNPHIPSYPDGVNKLLALNLSAVGKLVQ